MSLAALPTPTFTGADLSGRTNAALAEVRAARRFATAAALLADTALAYAAGARPVAAGDRIVTADGHRYEVAAAAATDHHVTTAGSVKLHVRPGPDGISFGAWAPDATGAADVTAKLQAFVNACVGSPAAPNGGPNRHRNIPGTIPAGKFTISNEIALRSVSGWHLSGAGQWATQITQVTANKAVFRTNGFEYSTVEGMALRHTAGTTGAILDLDWDNTGTAALQSNTFRKLFFEGVSGSDPSALSVQNGLRIGIGGYMGSENLIENCFFIWLRHGLHVWNYNALQNNVVGGNFQGCWKAIKVQAGSVSSVLGVGFQNDLGGAGFDQAAVNGWDIEITNTAGDATIISGCRSESLQFASFGNGHRGEVVGAQVIPSRGGTRANSTAVALGAFISVAVSGGTVLFKCSTAGTTGGSAPTWPATIYDATTVADGTVVWTRQDHFAIQGAPETRNSYVGYGRVGRNSLSVVNVVNTAFTRRDWQANNMNQSTAGTFTHKNVAPLPITQYLGYSDWAPTAPLSLGQTALLFEGNAAMRVGFEFGRSGGSGSNQHGVGMEGTLHARRVSGTDVAGLHTYIGGGPGTGNAAPGDIVFRKPVVGVSGGAEQTWAEGMRLLSATGGLRLGGTSGATWQSGTGSPEGVVTANIGSIYTRTDGSGATALYVKQSGTGTAGWRSVASLSGTLYPVGLSFGATPGPSEVVDRAPLVHDVTFPANFAGGAGAIGTNPAASLVLSVQDDGVEIGTITVSTGGAVAFATAGGTAKTVAAGSILTLVGPATPPLLAANLAVTLPGSLG